ncbi:MAG: aminotransferase class V-fold PLP-dependent enzyme [Bacillota bacterium]|nr:aminotransferase class V-fold PLP-dependent enzyme [Bacillota bacterium]
MSEKAIRTPIPSGGVGWYSFDEREVEAATAVLRNPEKLWRYHPDSVSSKFEAELEAKTGFKHALFVNSGTSALACALTALNVGPGDEVIVQAYTYIATASACLEVGAVPVIAEIDESLALDPADVERKITPHTKAIIVTHMQGVPGCLDDLRAVAKKHGVYLVEDACQAVGSKYKGKYTGMDSDGCAWSLNYYKVITCGEGGVFLTNDDRGSVRAYYQSDPAGRMWETGMENVAPDVHVFTRACYRANEVSAAIARVQLEKLDDILARTRRLKKTLLGALNEPIHYRRQHVDDPEGDCGISFAMIVKRQEDVEPFKEALAAQGLNLDSAFSAFPDRHIYAYWDSIMNKVGGSEKNYPWNDPKYQGNVEYSRDMCPQSLDILTRSLRLGITLAMSEQNMLEIAEAINRADAALG